MMFKFVVFLFLVALVVAAPKPAPQLFRNGLYGGYGGSTGLGYSSLGYGGYGGFTGLGYSSLGHNYGSYGSHGSYGTPNSYGLGYGYGYF